MAHETLIAIAVVQQQGMFLVGQRPAGVPLAGYWEFPGGKVWPNESASAAAIRECLEETGLTVEVTDEYPDVHFDYPHGKLHIRFFACLPRESGTPPQPPYRWVPRADLATLEFPPANAALMALLCAVPHDRAKR